MTLMAATHGHFDVITYLHKEGCPWHDNATLAAATNGHVHVLKYLNEKGCPLHNLDEKMVEMMSREHELK